MSTSPRGRLDRRPPSSLDPQARALYDRLTEGPRAGGPFPLVDAGGALEGPFNAMLLSPAVGTALQELGATLRYGTRLPDRAREIAILVVAAHWDSAFEQHAHEAVGRRIGLTGDELRALRRCDPLDLADPVEAEVLAVTRALTEHGDLDDDAYARAVAVLGEPALFELTTLAGYYATLALQLRLFRVAAPDEPGGAASAR